MSKNSSNLFNFDFENEGTKFKPLGFPIIDIHSHINGTAAVRLFEKAAKAYSITRVYSMTHLEEAQNVKNELGDLIQFIAMHDFNSADKVYNFGKGYTERIKGYHKLGAKIAKLWTAPRLYEFTSDSFANSPLRLDAPDRILSAKVAADLGMKIMVHVGDPDTWFSTKYRDSKKYGTKLQQYECLEVLLGSVNVPVIAAHMGGYPEDLDFLSKLLSRNSNLYLDCSAAKWVIRELSKHSRESRLAFFTTWKGRILFGSDIVTSDAHLSGGPKENWIAAKASDATEAFDLYASRYWGLRMLFESEYENDSPIADPDLNLVDPSIDANASPKLVGQVLPRDVLESLYYGAAKGLGLD